MSRRPHKLLVLGLRTGDRQPAARAVVRRMARLTDVRVVDADRRLARHLADLADLQKRGLLNEVECERARRRLLGH